MNRHIPEFSSATKRHEEIIVYRTIKYCDGDLLEGYPPVKDDDTYEISYFFEGKRVKEIGNLSHDLAFKIVFDEIMNARRDGVEHMITVNTLGEIPV